MLNGEIVAIRAERMAYANGISIAEMIRRANMTKCTMRQMRKCKRGPTMDTLLRLANVLGCSADYLVGKNDESPELMGGDGGG